MSSQERIEHVSGDVAGAEGRLATVDRLPGSAGVSDVDELWRRMQESIKKRLGLKRYGIWFKQTILMQSDASTLVIGVPSVIVKQYLERQYKDAVQGAAAELLGAGISVSFDVAPQLLRRERARRHAGSGSEEDESGGDQTARPEDPSPRASRAGDGQSPGAAVGLDEIILTEGVRLAYLAAVRIASTGEQRFPFMILVGGHGVGKTSLLKAAGNAAVANRSVDRCEYVMAESWWNEYHHAIIAKRTQPFRSRYRKCGMLVMDDVQYLDGKPGAQAELVHTIKSLLHSGRRVVLGSTAHPREFEDVSPALHALVADAFWVEMGPPLKHERLEVTRELARRQGLKAEDAVLRMLAENCGGNVRELNGLVRALANRAWLQGQDFVGMDDARRVLGATADRRRAPGMQDILAVLIEFLPVVENDIRGRSRAQAPCRARQIGMYLAREFTRGSLSDIGRFFGGRKHSTVKHSLARVAELVESDREIAALVERCRARLAPR